MKFKTLPFKITIMLFVVLIVSVNKLLAQQLTAQTATGLIKKNAGALGLSKADIQNSRISAAYVDKITGAFIGLY
jgi:hypothetical protein